MVRLQMTVPVAVAPSLPGVMVEVRLALGSSAVAWWVQAYYGLPTVRSLL